MSLLKFLIYFLLSILHLPYLLAIELSQTMQTLIILLLKEHYDQGLHYLPFCQLDELCFLDVHERMYTLGPFINK